MECLTLLQNLTPFLFYLVIYYNTIDFLQLLANPSLVTLL